MDQKSGIRNRFLNKRVLVMGLGLHGGGVGTVRFLAKRGARITITDLRKEKLLHPSLQALSRLRGIQYVLGKHEESDFRASDLIVKNPGVPPDSPYLSIARRYGVPVTSDVGIFFQYCPAAIIGVSGTRGKSTTAYLIWKFLTSKKRRGKVFLGGNIRKSMLEFLSRTRQEDLVVLELSSFQLQDLATERKSPHIAVLTNIFRDHLNRHRSFQEYQTAKSYLFGFQTPADYLFINPRDPVVRRLAARAPSTVVAARLPVNLRAIVDKNLGPHYRESVGLAIAVAEHYGVSRRAIRRVLRRFRGLEGRQEFVRSVYGVTFVNDTTATIPEAAVAAITRFREKPKKGGRLILIAGGQDKKLNFKMMASAIKRFVEVLVLLPGTASIKIKNQISKIKNVKITIREATSMAEAVRVAWKDTKRGDYVILSPGAASFGLFSNEFDRGKQFVNAVRKL